MESDTSLDIKYQKLASEYSKIRAQASVLKRAVLDEQNKNSCLREALRLKEVMLRRAEQEKDSLGFRNKQLEHRVASLQDDLDNEVKKVKNSKTNKTNNKNDTIMTETLITEELQKKIIENAQLSSLISDKNSELILCNERINDLELQLTKKNTDNTEVERKLRKELEFLNSRNSELEARVVEAGSMVGSEDGLSASGSDSTPVHTSISISSEERITLLEKEVNHWRIQYEIQKIGKLLKNEHDEKIQNGIEKKVYTNNTEYKHENNGIDELLFNTFKNKVEEIFTEKCLLESKLTTYMDECKGLQHNLEIISNELEKQIKKYRESQSNLQQSEEDLATTRINYEEQISVLTEQVINLSDQLAASK